MATSLSRRLLIIALCHVMRIVQTRGPKKHLKRLNAPKHWMLDKMGGIYAPKPSCGPHKVWISRYHYACMRYMC